MSWSLNRRSATRLLVGLALLACLYYLFAASPSQLPGADDVDLNPASFGQDELEDESVVFEFKDKSDKDPEEPAASGFDQEIRTLLDGAEEHRLQLIQYTPDDYALLEKRMGMSPGTLPQSKDAYFKRLRGVAERWFRGLDVENDVEDMIARFEARDIRLDAMAQRITSTDKNGPEGTPDGFEIWGEVATSEDGWTVDVLDDTRMEEMITQWTEGDGGKIKRIWDKLKFPVLKADLLRYYVLLLTGGIYTDSDTVPRAHPFDWGKPASEKTDPMLAMMDSDLSFIRDLHLHMNSEDRSRYKKGDGKMSITNPDVSIVISLEDNRWKEDDMSEWHGGTEIPDRRLSMCQWTMMARKGHPIFLDAIGTVLDNLESAVKDGHLDGSIRATELTGPPNFTDAVFRYLLIQHGITPRDLISLRTRQAVKIGDIIIYGPGSFGPMYKRRGDQGSGDVSMPVGHMYKGRWKGEGWD